MRGDFEIFGDGVKIYDPIAEAIPEGTVQVNLEMLIQGLVSPLGVVPANDASGRLFVYDQAGKVIVLQDDGMTATTFLDLSSRLVTLLPSYDERGLLGFALAVPAGIMQADVGLNRILHNTQWVVGPHVHVAVLVGLTMTLYAAIYILFPILTNGAQLYSQKLANICRLLMQPVAIG